VQVGFVASWLTNWFEDEIIRNLGRTAVQNAEPDISVCANVGDGIVMEVVIAGRSYSVFALRVDWAVQSTMGSWQCQESLRSETANIASTLTSPTKSAQLR